MKANEIAAADAMLAGFKSVSSLTSRWWVPGGLIHRRSKTSDKYLVIRVPRPTITIARLRPSTGRSSRMDLHVPSHVVSRQEFRRECTDDELAMIHWSGSQQDAIVLSVSTKPDELNEATVVGQVLGRLHNRGAFKDATFHSQD